MLIYKAYGVSYLHSLIFFGLILLIVVFPGLTIFSWLKITTSSLQTMSLAISLGFAASIIVAKFSRWLRIEALFFLWLLFAFLWCLRLVFRKPLSFSSAKLSQVFLIGVSALFLSFFIILLLDNFLMGRFLPTGEVALRMRFYDGFLRIAVIHELSHSLPPQLPFASGYRLSYHYGMDLFFSLFIRYGHLDVFDVCHRFGLTFLALLLFLNLSIFLKNFLNSDNLTLFGSFYVIFGSGGLAYLFCWLFKAPFTGNIFFNFYFHDLISLNSFLPALVILLAALNSFLWYEREAKVGWLVATSLFLATLFEFKVFLIIPVALSLLLSTSIQIIQNRKKQLIPLTMLTGFFSLPLFLTAVLSSQDIMGYRFSLKPIDWIIHVLRELRLTSWQETWSKLMMGKAQEPSSYLIGLAATLIFLIGAFGFNILAWPRALKSIFDSSGFKSFLASFSFLSIAYFFLFNLYLGRLTRHLLNIYVFYAGLIGLSLFFLLYLKETLNHQKALKRVIILTLIGLLSLPNTVFYTISRIKRPEIRLYSKNFVEAANWVRKTTSPE
ncbi:MAG: hypothetical protein N3B16_05900, partial [Candidatus Aminicenantes bacterium]|nr:hypothetical protein [Candidatus Aminicenantes bacterium]